MNEKHIDEAEIIRRFANKIGVSEYPSQVINLATDKFMMLSDEDRNKLLCCINKETVSKIKSIINSFGE